MTRTEMIKKAIKLTDEAMNRCNDKNSEQFNILLELLELLWRAR